MVMHISGEHAAVDGSARNTKHAAATTGSDSLSVIPEIQKVSALAGAARYDFLPPSHPIFDVVAITRRD